MTIQEAIERFYAHKDLSHGEMSEVMHDIMSGDVSPLLMGGFLVAIQVKGPTVEELSAAAAIMRGFSTKVIVGATCFTFAATVKPLRRRVALRFVCANLTDVGRILLPNSQAYPLPI